MEQSSKARVSHASGYTRRLTTRQINPLNDNITIKADTPNPNNGNASHHYVMCLGDPDVGYEDEEVIYNSIDFQDGPIKESGYNGFTNEALLEIVLDRLRAFQTSPFACRENAIAITHIEDGYNRLIERTQKRVQQGVEGTHNLHTENPTA